MILDFELFVAMILTLLVVQLFLFFVFADDATTHSKATALFPAECFVLLLVV